MPGSGNKKRARAQAARQRARQARALTLRKHAEGVAAHGGPGIPPGSPDLTGIADRRVLHSRSGDAIAIAAYLGGSDVFDKAITEFAAAYAGQNERDHQAFAAAAATGRVIAHSGL